LPGVADGATLHTVAPLSGDLDNLISAINDDGAAVGTSFDLNQQPNPGVRDAFFAPFSGTAQVLPRIQHGGQARSINNQNIVAGWSFADAAGNDHRAAVWQHDGSQWQVQNLGDFGRTDSRAFGINNENQVLIRADNDNSNVKHLLFDLDDGSVIDLPDTDPNGFAFNPLVLNDQGLVLDDDLWDSAAGQWVSQTRRARDINDLGQALDRDSPGIWQDDITLIADINDNLVTPDVTIFQLFRINDAGQILATGQLAGDSTAFSFQPAWLLTPVPEPATLGLLALGGLALLRRHKNN